MYSDQQKNGTAAGELETAPAQCGLAADEKKHSKSRSGAKLSFVVTKLRRQYYQTKSKKREHR
jgi:hypothetical protein